MDRGAWREYARSAEEELVRQHLPAARRLARRIAARSGRVGPGARDDVEQEAALAVIEAARHYDPSAGVPFGAYAMRRVRWRVVDYLRSQSVRARHELAEPGGTGAGSGGRSDDAAEELRRALADAADESRLSDVENEAIRRVLLSELEALVAALPERDRQILALRWDEELTFQEIGVLLGMDPSSVWERHARLLRDLAAGLRARRDGTGGDRA
jgi:RNA polymerase sigma factor for flagellar operon FliA